MGVVNKIVGFQVGDLVRVRPEYFSQAYWRLRSQYRELRYADTYVYDELNVDTSFVVDDGACIVTRMGLYFTFRLEELELA